MNHRAAERLAVAAMVAATLLWGATFVAIRDGVARIPAATLVCGRISVAAALFGVMLLVRRRPLAWRALTGGFVAGLSMLGGYFFQARGLQYTSAGSSAFLTCAGSLFAAFFAWPLLRQRPSRVIVAGVVVALAGSALLSLQGGLALGKGELLTLIGASSFALQIVLLARLAPHEDMVTLAFAQTFTIAACLWPFAGAPHAVVAQLASIGWARFGYLAIAGSTIAPLLQLFAQRRIAPGRVGLLFALEPVFALVFAITLGAEHFVLRWWIGAALILAAVLFVEWRAAADAPATELSARA